MTGINDFLKERDDEVGWNLKTLVQIIDSDTFPSLDGLLLEKRRWVQGKWKACGL